MSGARPVRPPGPKTVMIKQSKSQEEPQRFSVGAVTYRVRQQGPGQCRAAATRGVSVRSSNIEGQIVDDDSGRDAVSVMSTLTADMRGFTAEGQNNRRVEQARAAGKLLG